MALLSSKSKYPDRVKDLEAIKTVLDSFGVRFFLVYGAVLGWQRDGDFIEHDDDIDIAIIDDINFETRKKIGHMLLDLGFKTQPIAFNVFGRMESGEDGYNGDDNSGIIVCERAWKFTIFFFKNEWCEKHTEFEYVCTPKLGALKLISTPFRFFEKVGGYQIKINKKNYSVPGPIKDYLAYSYKNWKDKKGRDHSPLYNQIHENN